MTSWTVPGGPGAGRSGARVIDPIAGLSDPAFAGSLIAARMCVLFDAQRSTLLDRVWMTAAGQSAVDPNHLSASWFAGDSPMDDRIIKLAAAAGIPYAGGSWRDFLLSLATGPFKEAGDFHPTPMPLPSRLRPPRKRRLPAPRPSLPSAVYTPAELAHLLQLSPRKIRAMKSSGVLPKPLPFGRVVRWCRTDIHRWLEGLGAP